MPATGAAVITVINFMGDDRLRLHACRGTPAFVAGHFIAYSSASRPTKACADNRAVLAAALLPDRRTSSTTDGASNDRTFPTAALSGRRGAKRATSGTADNGAVIAP